MELLQRITRYSLEMEKPRRNRQSYAGSSGRQSAANSDQIGFGWRVEEYGGDSTTFFVREFIA
jgi:hypothetical protein